MADNYLITGYWGEPHVTAENDRGINAGIFGTGRMVLPVGEQFKAEYIGNNTIRMYDGKLMDNGAAGGIPAGEYVDLLIANAGQGKKRNDLIVFQYEQDASTLVESGKFVVIQGAETEGTAADPALTQEDLLSGNAVFDQFALWRVSVSGATISTPVQLFTVSTRMSEMSTKEYVDVNKVDKTHVANNFTTTASGYVADARALKTLNDGKVDKSQIINNYLCEDAGFVPDARALKRAFDALNSNFNMDLLWTNASPTSTFASQNITLDVSQYKLLLFQFRPCASYELLDTALCVKGQRGWLSSVTGSAGQAGAYAFTVWRQIAVNSTGNNNVVIYTGYKNGKNNMTPEEENNYAVPYRIYGIKGGITT